MYRGNIRWPQYLALAVMTTRAPTATAADQRSCDIAIDTPLPGTTVGRGGIAEGSAAIPSGKFLWAYARLRGETEVFPQGGSARVLEGGGRWAVHVYWGERQDVGLDFELLLQVIDANENANLAAWVEKVKE
jgi:hypothetical protein